MACKFCGEPLAYYDAACHNLSCQSCRVLKSELIHSLGYTREAANEKLSYGQTPDGKMKYWGMRLNKEREKRNE